MLVVVRLLLAFNLLLAEWGARFGGASCSLSCKICAGNSAERAHEHSLRWPQFTKCHLPRSVQLHPVVWISHYVEGGWGGGGVFFSFLVFIILHSPLHVMYKRNERMSIKQAIHTHYKCSLDITDSKSTQKQRAFYTAFSLCWLKFYSALCREAVKTATLRRVFFFAICTAAQWPGVR